jgi:phosphonate transport system ATP-binding protein
MTVGVLMPEPDLLLADEPTSSLDLKTSIEIMELISNGDSHLVPAGNC